MRVMWVLNSPLARLARVMGVPGSDSGSWVEAAHETLEAEGNVTMAVASTTRRKGVVSVQDGGCRYYCLDLGSSFRVRPGRIRNVRKWSAIIQEFEPDIIQLWGSEFSAGLDVMSAAGDIPIVLYLQGIMKSVVRYYWGGLSQGEILKGSTLFDRVKNLKMLRDHRRRVRQVALEERLAAGASAIVINNQWMLDQVRPILPRGTPVFRHCFPVRDLFFRTEWNIHTADPLSIFTVAGRNAQKGLHVLVRAVALVREKHPGVRLYIPGGTAFSRSWPRSWLTLPPYLSYLRRLIRTLGVVDNVVFVGALKAEGMAEKMRTSRLFVMPSAIESNSSTLLEAMAVGMPSITSFVGCVQEYVVHGHNAFCYRYEEHETLARHIATFLEDPEECERMGGNARRDVAAYLKGDPSQLTLSAIYRKVLSVAAPSRRP